MACNCGVNSVAYWEMSYGEIIAAINAYQSQQKDLMQMHAVMGYRQANLISSLVSRIMGGKHKVPTLADAYPGVFPEELFKPRAQDWRVMKDRIAAHGERHKRKRGEAIDAGRVADPHNGGNKQP